MLIICIEKPINLPDAEPTTSIPEPSILVGLTSLRILGIIQRLAALSKSK
jgi:hypothetical protein